MHGDAPGKDPSESADVPPEIVAMGSCLPAMVFERRFTRGMGITGLPRRVGGMRRSEYLVNHGYELAWRSGQFETVEQFRKAMRAWHRWAVALLVFEAVMFALAAAEAIVWYAQHWWHH
ncbi:MAG: hypothetical protein KKI08_03570 [Armatimonadetes bacterium]|nr:hypothetical protein [Armatimonadota bacterium]